VSITDAAATSASPVKAFLIFMKRPVTSENSAMELVTAQEQYLAMH
jgi:hypothetical protein